MLPNRVGARAIPKFCLQGVTLEWDGIKII